MVSITRYSLFASALQPGREIERGAGSPRRPLNIRHAYCRSPPAPYRPPHFNLAARGLSKDPRAYSHVEGSGCLLH
jgi:hypothetical protein